jgi:hypothetical protein
MSICDLTFDDMYILYFARDKQLRGRNEEGDLYIHFISNCLQIQISLVYKTRLDSLTVLKDECTEECIVNS